MADQARPADAGDIADERGRITPVPSPDDEATTSDHGIDEIGTAEAASDPPPSNGSQQGAAAGDLAVPDADANFPDPSRPISTGAGSPPARSGSTPGGGYGDSRGTAAAGDPAGAHHPSP